MVRNVTYLMGAGFSVKALYAEEGAGKGGLHGNFRLGKGWELRVVQGYGLGEGLSTTKNGP